MQIQKYIEEKWEKELLWSRLWGQQENCFLQATDLHHQSGKTTLMSGIHLHSFLAVIRGNSEEISKKKKKDCFHPHTPKFNQVFKSAKGTFDMSLFVLSNTQFKLNFNNERQLSNGCLKNQRYFFPMQTCCLPAAGRKINLQPETRREVLELIGKLKGTSHTVKMTST